MTTVQSGPLVLRVGDVVEIRSQAEIEATLDENGELESLPFMPEMLQYCGRRLTVGKVAHKLCDTMTRSGIRKMESAVHLAGVRCDGSGHGGCQAACLIYWKHAWLRKVDPADGPPEPPSLPEPPGPAAPALLPLLTIAARRPPAEDGEPRYRCQSTELLRAAPEQLPVRNLAQYVEDVRVGNVGPLASTRAFLVGLYNRLQDISAARLPSWLTLRGGRHWGNLRGKALKTPTGQTGLQVGDLVRIRSRAEIETTLNADLLNRGMGFDAEMGRFCGRTARVARRVDHIIDEHTGRMLRMKSPCLVLEGLICEGAFNSSCPRSITPYWREIWLEKVSSPVPSVAQDDGLASIL